MEFSGQEYWSGLLFSSPGHIYNFKCALFISRLGCVCVCIYVYNMYLLYLKGSRSNDTPVALGVPTIFKYHSPFKGTKVLEQNT